jgi:hypothetical protein
MKTTLLVLVLTMTISTNALSMSTSQDGTKAASATTITNQAEGSIQVVSDSKQAHAPSKSAKYYAKVVAGPLFLLVGLVAEIVAVWPNFTIIPYYDIVADRSFNKMTDDYFRLCPPQQGNSWVCHIEKQYYLLHENWLERFEPITVRIVGGPYKELIGTDALLVGTTEEFFGDYDERIDGPRKTITTYNNAFEQYKKLFKEDSFIFSAPYVIYRDTRCMLHNNGKSIFYGCLKSDQTLYCLHEDWLVFKSEEKKKAMIALSHKIGQRLMKVNEAMKKLNRDKCECDEQMQMDASSRNQ